MKKMILVWIFIICSIAFSLEFATRQWEFAKNSWYDKLYFTQQQSPLKYIFLGSSRVAASINVQTVKKLTGENAYNIGQGFSTLHEHYLGLREYFARFPKAGKGLKIFVEQGAHSFELWTGQPMPTEEIYDAMKSQLKGSS